MGLGSGAADSLMAQFPELTGMLQAAQPQPSTAATATPPTATPNADGGNPTQLPGGISLNLYGRTVGDQPNTNTNNISENIANYTGGLSGGFEALNEAANSVQSEDVPDEEELPTWV